MNIIFGGIWHSLVPRRGDIEDHLAEMSVLHNTSWGRDEQIQRYDETLDALRYLWAGIVLVSHPQGAILSVY